MSLTEQQKMEINKMRHYLKSIEKETEPDNIYLDVFFTNNSIDGISLYSTERVEIKEKATSRKEVFVKATTKKEANYKRV